MPEEEIDLAFPVAEELPLLAHVAEDDAGDAVRLRLAPVLEVREVGLKLLHQFLPSLDLLDDRAGREPEALYLLDEDELLRLYHLSQGRENLPVLERLKAFVEPFKARSLGDLPGDVIDGLLLEALDFALAVALEGPQVIVGVLEGVGVDDDADVHLRVAQLRANLPDVALALREGLLGVAVVIHPEVEVLARQAGLQGLDLLVRGLADEADDMSERRSP